MRRAVARLAALLLAAAAGTAGAVEPHQPAATDSVAGRLLQAQTLGADPATGWSWLRAWGQSFPDDPMAYRQLRRGLVDLYLRQAIGEPIERDATLASVRAAGAALPPLEQDRDAQARWAGALQRGLAPLRAADGPVPHEIESLANRLEALAPGLWLTRQADGRARNLVWALQVAVRGTVPLAPQALEARVAAPGQPPLVFDCPAERGQPRAVQPGDTWRLLCRSRSEVDLRGPALHTLVEALRRDGAAAPTWASADLQRSGLLEPMIDALTLKVPDRTARFAHEHRACELRGRCHLEGRSASSPRRHAVGPGRASPPEADRDRGAPWVAAPTARQLAQGLAGGVAAFIVFCLVARTVGERVAAVLTVILLLPLAWRYGLGHGAASLLLVGGVVAAALLVAGVFLVAYWLYDALVFSRVAPRAAGRRRGRRASA